MKYGVLTVVIGLFAAACATTDDGSSASATAAVTQTASAEEAGRMEDENYDPDAIRCERETVIGSRLPAREVCRPESEWRAIREGARETMDHIRRQPIPNDPNDG